MRIIVCLKESLDYDPSWQRDYSPRPHDILPKIDPQELLALEEALQLRENLGGEVIALSFDDNERGLRRALTCGADKAVLIEDTIQNF